MLVYTTVRFVYGDSFDPTNQGELFREYYERQLPELPVAVLLHAACRWYEIADELPGGPPLVSVQIWWQGEESVPESSWPKTLPGWRGHPKRLPSLRTYRRALMARALEAIAAREPAVAPRAASRRADRRRDSSVASRPSGTQAGGTSVPRSRRKRA